VVASADAFRRIVRALRVSSRGAEAAVGLSGAQLFVLEKLSGAGALSLGELATRTRTHQSSVSVVVGRLVEKGLVTRERAADDARRVDIAITAAGRRLLRGAPEAAQERLFAAVGALAGADQRELARLLGLLARAMGAAEGPAALFFEDDADGGGEQ
ncbi:MAG: hypothetical protein JWM10_2351, partial [Myxococcaceae bacterium]|nr:hypothetical protein [Myxococcaceae bacterium]